MVHVDSACTRVAALMKRGSPAPEVEADGHDREHAREPEPVGRDVGQERREQRDRVLDDGEFRVRRRTWPMSQPIPRPTTTPPAPVTRSWSAARPGEKVPVTTAATPIR